MATKILVTIDDIPEEEVPYIYWNQGFVVKLVDEDSNRSGVLYESNVDVFELSKDGFIKEYDKAINEATLWNKNLNLNIVRSEEVLEVAGDIDEELPQLLKRLERMV